MQINNKFTEKAKAALEYARMSACDLGHTYIGSEHILLGLLCRASGDTPAMRILSSCGVDYKDARAQLMLIMGKGEPTHLTSSDFTPRTKRIIENSYTEARRYGQGYIGTEHILLSLSLENDSVAGRLLSALGADMGEVYTKTTRFLTNANYFEALDKASADGSFTEVQIKQLKKQTPILNNYSRDLTEDFFLGKLDPVIGREEEIEKVIRVLSRRNKNNPCLVGEPGVGKTAIAEGIAGLICEGKVPEAIAGKRIVSLNLTSVISGAKYRGEFEERFKTIIEEVIKSGNVILLIDEIHNIVGAGAAEGAIDAANILKPMLTSNDDLRLIGATTVKEYRKYIEKDSALERRFRPIYVNEPSDEDAVKIILGLRDRYEAFHKVKISDEAIVSAVNLSKRYISDRFLPDKAIDLIDEASARVKAEALKKPNDMVQIKSEMSSLAAQKEEAVKSEEFELAKTLLEEERRLSKNYDEKKEKLAAETTIVTYDDIAKIVTGYTGIPTERIMLDEKERLCLLSDELKKRIIGQDKAIELLVGAIKRNRVGLRDPNRPCGSFIFIGPTGVGKTALAKALAENLFCDSSKFIKLDMSEYTEKHSISRLVGSPPGYVGYDEAGQLTEKVRRSPYSVVLFDEIEKAHVDVLNILLQILEDGVLTDSQGRSVNFKNTIIIMTSNIGSEELAESKSLLGFNGKSNISHDEAEKIIKKRLRSYLKPELIGRIDDIIVFRRLETAELATVAKSLLAQVCERASGMGIVLEYTDATPQNIVKKSFESEYGVRNIRKYIRTNIEDTIASRFLAGEIKNGDRVQIDCTEEEKIKIEVIN